MGRLHADGEEAPGCGILLDVPSGLRTSVVALVVSAATVMAATALVPPRVRFGSYSFVCDSMLTPRPFDQIATAICEISGAYRLRATVAIAALLAVLSFIPMLLERTRFSGSKRVHLLWASTVLVVAGVTITLLAVVGAPFRDVFLDLQRRAR